MRKKLNTLIISSLLVFNIFIPTHQAHAEVCKDYNFQSLFYRAYYPGTKWDNSSGNRTISWSANASVIKDESVTRPFTPEELTWVRSAFQSWDDALETVSFFENTQPSAEITIGYVAFTSVVNQAATGYWDAWWGSDNMRTKATMKLRASSTDWFSDKNKFIHAIQHQLGHVLGLGDILPSSEFASTQEDELQPPYGPIPLNDFDTGMIRQLYGEPTCPSTFPSTKIAAEAKAVAALAATKKKTTITCVKAKLSKKVTAIKPVCPTGYKKK